MSLKHVMVMVCKVLYFRHILVCYETQFSNILLTKKGPLSSINFYMGYFNVRKHYVPFHYSCKFYIPRVGLSECTALGIAGRT